MHFRSYVPHAILIGEILYLILLHSQKFFFFFSMNEISIYWTKTTRYMQQAANYRAPTLTQKPKVFFFPNKIFRYLSKKKDKIQKLLDQHIQRDSPNAAKNSILRWEISSLHPAQLINHFHFSSNSLIMDSHIPLSQNMINRCSPSQFAN